MKRKQKIVVSIIIFLIVVFTSFGYAALNTELQISGEAYVRVEDNIRITNLKLNSITGGYEAYNSKYSKDSTSMFITLTSGASATYEVEVTNKSNEDYFLKSINSDNSNYELIDTKIYDVFTGSSVRKFYVKITNNTSLEKSISLNLEYEFVKDEIPTIALADLPKWNTKGDDYAVVPTYSSITGGNVNCKSNLDPSVENVTDLKDLMITGVHNITCTVTSGTGKTASVTKSTKITYDPYNTKNLIVNGSFENGTSSWSGFSGIFSTSSAIYKFGTHSGYAKRTNQNIHIVQNYNLVKGHHYYAMEWVYLSESFSGNGQFDLYRAAGTIAGYPEYVNANFFPLQPRIWQKLSGVFVSDVSHLYSFRAAYMLDGNITVYFDGTTLIDLTEIFGAGLEPDKKWCDKHIEYFDGTTIIYK